MVYSQFYKKGFTLIELLITIAIIGVLSSIVMSSLSTAKVTARDTMRRQQARQIQTGLEMYINDTGRYPQLTTSGTTATGVSEIGLHTLNSVLVPSYMNKNVTYDQTNIADASYMSDTTKPNQYVLRLAFEKPIITTPSIQYTCKTGVGAMVNMYYPGVPLCTK